MGTPRGEEDEEVCGFDCCWCDAALQSGGGISAGVRVDVIQGTDICRKGEGGPTCMTRPLVRGQFGVI